MKLRIHNPCNEETRYYRNYNLFWDELTDKLKEKYEIVENRYYKDANRNRFQVYFDSLQNKNGLLLMECEYVIENMDNGDFYVLSVADNLSQAMLSEQNNSKLKKVLISQFIDYEVKHHVRDNFSKYYPWIYFPMNLTDLEYYYNERNKKTNLIDKLYFRGNTRERPILQHFDKEIFNGPYYIGDSSKYFEELINYSVALSIAGVGEICYRDIECMAIGVPILRFEYQSKFYEPLIPNYHYISIPYDNSIPKHNGVHTDRLGESIHAKKLEQRFKDVINDKEFLKFISKNARKYYEENLSSSVRVNKTLEILGL